MFTRQLFAAAALMAATCGAHADVISTSTVSGLGSDMSIVDGNSSLGNDLASLLATPNSSAQLVLVRGIEGLYMLASRTAAPLATEPGSTDITAPALADIPPAIDSPAADIPAAADADPVVPVADATDVPEPGSLALMLAGVLGAAGFTRARKQG